MSIDARRAVVVLNPNSGISRDGKPQDEIQAALDAVGITSEFILLQRGLDLKELIEERTKLGCDVVVAAGGDGTVSTVGALLAGTDVALGVLPTGTLNHFAKDLGIPLDLNAATEVIARGATTLVDVGEVNGHIFLNNSSIGLYTTIVTERERLMQRGLSKPLAAFAAGMIALWRFPDATIRVMTESTGLVTRTPLVFVGNNRYEFSGLQAGKRTSLEDGLLQVTALRASRAALIKAALLAIGRVNADPDLLTLDTHWAKVDTFRRHVKVALDGEVTRLHSPLQYLVRPRALKVIVDRRAGEEAER